MIDKDEKVINIKDVGKNVLSMSKFKAIINKARQMVTRKVYEPTMFIDSDSVITALGQTNLLQSFIGLKKNHTHYEFVWEVENGDVRGVTITCFNQEERNEQE